jgi:MFS family permease
MNKPARSRVVGRDRLPPLLPVILLLELVALGATIPTIAYYARGLGGTAFHVTLCFFLTAAPKVFFQPMWGSWSDRIGRRPVMVLSQIGSLLSYLAWALAPSLSWLLASRAIYGLFGAQLTVASSIVADRLAPEARARGMGVLGAIAGVGFVIGPAAGGILAGKLGNASVGWIGVGLEVCAVALALALPETAPRRAAAPRGPSAARAFRLALSHPVLGALLLVVLIGTTGISVIQGTLVVLAEDRWGYQVVQMGKMLSVFFLVGALVQGFGLRTLIPRFGEKNLARAGHALAAGGLAVLVPRAPAVFLWIALFLISIGIALLTPTMTSLLSQAASEEEQGRVQGMNQGMTGLGRSISGATMGGAYDHLGPGTPFALSALLVLAALLLLFVRADRRAPAFRIGGG